MWMDLERDKYLYSSPRSRGETWHLYRVILPRRSITGRLVCGLVWRRRGRKRWLYKRFERTLRVE